MRGYITNLAAILRKAQGVIDAATNHQLDIGGEVLAIRQEGDALNARIAELEKECAVLREDSESCTNEMCRQADLKDDALARIAALEADRKQLATMLLHYVHSVPLGHQPHMSAQPAEKMAMAALGTQREIEELLK